MTPEVRAKKLFESVPQFEAVMESEVVDVIRAAIAEDREERTKFAGKLCTYCRQFAYAIDEVQAALDKVKSVAVAGAIATTRLPPFVQGGK